MDNAAHRERVNGIVPWNAKDSAAIGHNDVFALPDNLEPRFFERLGNRRYCRHALCRDVHFPEIVAASQLFGDFEIRGDGVPDIGQCLFFGRILRPAPRETRAGDAVAILSLHQSDRVFHVFHYRNEVQETVRYWSGCRWGAVSGGGAPEWGDCGASDAGQASLGWRWTRRG